VDDAAVAAGAPGYFELPAVEQLRDRCGIAPSFQAQGIAEEAFIGELADPAMGASAFNATYRTSTAGRW
jgi:hypothetical protein